MSLAALLNRAPYRVRFGTQAIVEDRHGASAFLVFEPLNDPRQRIEDAEAWAATMNAAASHNGGVIGRTVQNHCGGQHPPRLAAGAAAHDLGGVEA